jgi:hypothetical protein
MKKILVLFPYQWGYNTDYLFYCKLLQEKYAVTYIGYDLNLPSIPTEGVRVIAVAHRGKLSLINLYSIIFKELKKGEYDFLLVNYFITCSLLLLFARKNTKKIVDIRTSFIYTNKLKSRFLNAAMRFETGLYKNITVISEGVKQFLHLRTRAHVLPLGAPAFPLYKKSFDELAFLYVGTFFDRNIVNTIEAFKRLIHSHQDKINLKYTIIGYGTAAEVKAVSRAITDNELESFVSYKGTIRYPELNAYFSSHNVGVSYIPLTPYYDCQPPTKTFEYMLSGHATLGTNTSENRRLINKHNGVLTGDSIEEFYAGMVAIYNARHTYNSLEIQRKAKGFTWDAIVNQNLVPYLSRCK